MPHDHHGLVGMDLKLPYLVLPNLKTDEMRAMALTTVIYANYLAVLHPAGCFDDKIFSDMDLPCLLDENDSHGVLSRRAAAIAAGNSASNAFPDGEYGMSAT
jgi:hypothetical protein